MRNFFSFLFFYISCSPTVYFNSCLSIQEGLCAIIGTIRRGFEDLYEAKEILLNGDESDFFEINNRDISDNVLSRRSYYFGPSSGSVGMVRKNGNNQYRKAIPKTSYGSRRASFNSLLTLGKNFRLKLKNQIF